MVTPSEPMVIQRVRVVTSIRWPVGLSPRMTCRAESSANCPEAGIAPVPDPSGYRALPSRKTCSEIRQRIVGSDGSQRLSLSLATGKGGTVSWLIQVNPVCVQAVQTSEPRISAPGCPASVSGLLIVIDSRNTHGGTVTVEPGGAASTRDCNVPLQAEDGVAAAPPA